MADGDREAGALLGKRDEEFVAAGASENVNALKLAAEHLLKAGECRGVAGGETSKDQTREARLVTRGVGDGRASETF